MTNQPVDVALSRSGRALFGAVMIAPENATEVRQLIPTNIFVRRQDRLLYEAILTIEWPDIVRVRRYVVDHQSITDIPVGYISQCIKDCPMCWEYKSYADACIYYAGLLAEMNPPKPKKTGLIRESA